MEQEGYKKFIVDSRLKYFKPHSARIDKTFAEQVSAGLNSHPKFILPKFLYDKKGSEMFEKICSLPEYYPTNSEISILEEFQDELAGHIDDKCRLVELGSGSSVKTRLMLDVFDRIQNTTEYFPIDISNILAESSRRLLLDYDRLYITGIIDTYDGGLEFLKKFDGIKNMIVFLGSSYGNFTPSEGSDFLGMVNQAMKPGDLFLVGLDMIKDKDMLWAAYNDSQGVTAEFNLNVLSRINDELDADFDLNNFEHHAIYNEQEQRIEMYIRSLVNQSVIISGLNQKIRLERDELIHTEYSHKFELGQIHDLLRDAGFEVVQTWHDDKEYFSLTLSVKR